jgi:hypothetical protein
MRHQGRSSSTQRQLEACLSVATGAAVPHSLGAALDGVDWEDLLRAAEQARVASLVHRALRNVPGVPAEIRRSLRNHYRATAARVAQLRTHLVMIIRVLNAADVPVVLLKGASLTFDVWTDIGLRPWSDIDLLVPRHQVIGATGALAGLGFRPGRFETTAGATLAHESELLLVGPGGCLVDLHWCLFDSPHYQARTSATAIQPATRRVVVQDDIVAAVMTPEMQLLHLCGHLVLHHEGTELLWLSDVAALLRRYRDDLDWTVVLADAHRFDLVVALQRVISTVVATLAAPVSVEVMQRVCASRPSRAESTVVRQLADRERSMATRLWFDLLTMGGWRERVAFLRTRMFPSRAYMRARYGVQHPVMVALAYPYRWLIGLRRGSLGA